MGADVFSPHGQVYFLTLPMKVSNKTQGLLSQLHDQRWVRTFLSASKMEDRISLLRAYNVQEQKEEAIIQFLLDKLDPPKSSVTFESQVRNEKDLAEQKSGKSIQTPEEEKYWQDRINKARAMDQEAQAHMLMQHYQAVNEVLPEVTLQDYFPGAVVSPPSMVDTSVPKHDIVQDGTVQSQENELKTIPVEVVKKYPDNLRGDDEVTKLPGIAEASAKRLTDANIITISQLFAMTYEQATAVLKTPLVIARYKDFFEKTIIVNNV